MIKNSFFLILGVCLVVGSIFYFLKQDAGDSLAQKKLIKVVVLGQTRVEVEVAATPEARARGLSGREALLPNFGMLFSFETPGKYGFWMKEMNFPIDIIWIGEDLRVVSVSKELSPDSFPQSFYPMSEISYALEVPAGFSEASNIEIGALVHFEYKN